LVAAARPSALVLLVVFDEFARISLRDGALVVSVTLMVFAPYH